ncbi:hypothetical protein OLMES_2665 [Oleiphilus messinensis]|uniref:Uncharacterized protein n=1 Tax=Oleiphilus messinensis TaxID=141451 RepID=A0A1Y0IB70_9GAMM|nr:hypothetical protein [Oleiphilus messinensis]ARU56715.1 hypothetical protein OLMES_2665 [Oleiphilus messinensis]
MGYVVSDTTFENCMRLQKEWVDRMIRKGDSSRVILGPLSCMPIRFETPYGSIGTGSPWAVDHERNYYLIETNSIAFEIRSFVFNMDGNIYHLVTLPFKPYCLQQLSNIKDLSLREKIETEVITALRLCVDFDHDMYFKDAL